MAETEAKAVKDGPVRALGTSKKYAMAATVVGAALGLSAEAALRGDFAGSVAAIWPGAIVAAAYTIGQSIVDALKKA